MLTLKNKIKNKKGFTLLFAVLVSTLVVAVGASVISVALRQTILSGTSRESQYAFYATNTALECAFYWDTTSSISGGSFVFPISGQTRISDTTNLRCSGGNIATGDGFTSSFANKPWDIDTPDTTTIYLEVKDTTNMYPGVYCAQATISKVQDTTTGIITTTIEAKGYNTCDLSSPRAVERGLVQSYQS